MSGFTAFWKTERGSTKKKGGMWSENLNASIGTSINTLWSIVQFDGTTINRFFKKLIGEIIAVTFSIKEIAP